MFQSDLKSGRFFGDFSSFAAEYTKAIRIIGEFMFHIILTVTSIFVKYR